MKNLKKLGLEGCNKLKNLAPLAKLKSLETLSVSSMQIYDIGPLGSLSNLKQLSIYESSATDYSPLARLTNLQSCSLGMKTLNPEQIKLLGGPADVKSKAVAIKVAQPLVEEDATIRMQDDLRSFLTKF